MVEVCAISICDPGPWMRAVVAVAQFQLAEMEVVVRSREQRLEDEGLSSTGFELTVPVDADFAFAGLGAAGGHVEEVLRIGDGGRGVVSRSSEAFRGIGADELGPVAREQL